MPFNGEDFTYHPVRKTGSIADRQRTHLRNLGRNLPAGAAHSTTKLGSDSPASCLGVGRRLLDNSSRRPPEDEKISPRHRGVTPGFQGSTLHERDAAELLFVRSHNGLRLSFGPLYRILSYPIRPCDVT